MFNMFNIFNLFNRNLGNDGAIPAALRGMTGKEELMHFMNSKCPTSEFDIRHGTICYFFTDTRHRRTYIEIPAFMVDQAIQHIDAAREFWRKRQNDPETLEMVMGMHPHYEKVVELRSMVGPTRPRPDAKSLATKAIVDAAPLAKPKSIE